MPGKNIPFTKWLLPLFGMSLRLFIVPKLLYITTLVLNINYSCVNMKLDKDDVCTATDEGHTGMNTFS